MRTLRFSNSFISALFVLCVSGAYCTLYKIRALHVQTQDSTKHEVLYLPDPSAVVALSFGYGEALSHLLWFDTISYFGKHYKQDQSYPWLYHMCNLVAELNPSLLHVYTFCGTMLSWEASNTDNAIAILSKGERALPTSWELPYLIGFTQYYFKKDTATASQYFLSASQKPKAPDFLKTLAAKSLSMAGDTDEAISFLTLSIQNTPEGEGREALRKKLAKIISARDIPKIEAAAKKFYDERGVYPRSVGELIKGGYLTPQLQRPGPGRYVIQEGKVGFEYGVH